MLAPDARLLRVCFVPCFPAAAAERLALPQPGMARCLIGGGAGDGEVSCGPFALASASTGGAVWAPVVAATPPCSCGWCSSRRMRLQPTCRGRHRPPAGPHAAPGAAVRPPTRGCCCTEADLRGASATAGLGMGEPSPAGLFIASFWRRYSMFAGRPMATFGKDLPAYQPAPLRCGSMFHDVPVLAVGCTDPAAKRHSRHRRCRTAVTAPPIFHRCTPARATSLLDPSPETVDRTRYYLPHRARPGFDFPPT